MSLPQSNQPRAAFKSALPGAMIFFGGALTGAGLLASLMRNGGGEFGFAWLLAFMFYYSVALGALFLVMVHHLTDAGWSVGIRRFCEHIASLLFPWLLILFLPVGIFGSKIYSWMRDPAPGANNMIMARYPVFTTPGFWVTSLAFFAIWWFLTSRLCRLSLEQDETGSPECYRKMRFHSGWGVVA